MAKKQSPKKQLPKKDKKDITLKIKATPDEALKALLSQSIKKGKK